MRPRDFLALSAVCLIWGLNFVVSKWLVVGDGPGGSYLGAPPLFLAGFRFGVVALVLSPMLRPVPKQLLGVAAVGVCMGALNFGLLFVGLQYATPSAAAVTIQLVPVFTTILSVIFLGETVGWRRAGGIVLAIIGVVLIAYDPETFALSLGVVLVTGAAFSGSVSNIVIKRIDNIGPWRMQAWMGLVSAPLLLSGSLLFEHGQFEAIASGGWRFAVGMAHTIFLVSMGGFAVFYVMLRRYEASVVAPLTLMAPLWGMGFGVMLYGDAPTWRLFVGGAMAIVGVAVIAIRSGATPGTAAGTGAAKA